MKRIASLFLIILLIFLSIQPYFNFASAEPYTSLAQANGDIDTNSSSVDYEKKLREAVEGFGGVSEIPGLDCGIPMDSSKGESVNGSKYSCCNPEEVKNFRRTLQEDSDVGNPFSEVISKGEEELTPEEQVTPTPGETGEGGGSGGDVWESLGQIMKNVGEGVKSLPNPVKKAALGAVPAIGVPILIGGGIVRGGSKIIGGGIKRVIEGIPGVKLIIKSSQLVKKMKRASNSLINVGEDVNSPVCFAGGIPAVRDGDSWRQASLTNDGGIEQGCICLAKEYAKEEGVVNDEVSMSNPSDSPNVLGVAVQQHKKNINEICSKYAGAEEDECDSCMGNNNPAYYSAIGCIHLEPKEFILNNIFGTGLKLAGLYVFFCIIFSAIEIQISQGNKEKIKKAQERITACIIGLLVVIFSVFILKIVGVNILGLPALN